MKDNIAKRYSKLDIAHIVINITVLIIMFAMSAILFYEITNYGMLKQLIDTSVSDTMTMLNERY